MTGKENKKTRTKKLSKTSTSSSDSKGSEQVQEDLIGEGQYDLTSPEVQAQNVPPKPPVVFVWLFRADSGL